MFFSLTLDNLESQNEYLVSLDLQVCLESGSACAISVSVLKDTKLQKTSCNWTAGLGGTRYYNRKFIIKGYNT